MKKLTFSLIAVILPGLLFFVTGRDSNNASAEQKEPTTYSRSSRLSPGASWLRSSIGVALADMDGDGDLDLVSAAPDCVKYFENVGNESFVDRGIIVRLRAHSLQGGTGITIGDIDSDGVLDIVIAAPDGIHIIKNPVPQKK